jgi:ferrous iron transport protein B
VLGDALQAALQTVPDNLLKVADNLLDPLGLGVGDVSDLSAAAAAQEVDSATFAAMQASFDGKIGAFAYLLFILLYTPCVAATAAIYKETGRNWAVFVVCWTTGLAYTTATLFYQLMTFAAHPGQSLLWALGLLGLLLAVMGGFWWRGRLQAEGE